jgi:hypothetical protein
MDDRFTLVNAAQRLLGQNGAMSREETDYFLSRAEQELARARLSDHPDAVRAHSLSPASISIAFSAGAGAKATARSGPATSPDQACASVSQAHSIRLAPRRAPHWKKLKVAYI